MKSIVHFLTRGLPMTAWVMVIYAVLVFAFRLFSEGSFIDLVLFTIPTLNTALLVVTGGWLLVVLAFIALIIENFRATRIRDSTGNDYLSVLALIVALLLLIGVEAFGTMVFATIFIAALIDVLQDRIIGQAVARRDWGVQMQPPAG